MKNSIVQTDRVDMTEVMRSDEIYVYLQGRRYHSREHCRSVTNVRSEPLRYTRCQICGWD
eukprot:5830623-Amphidinium_carterae.1